MEEGKTQAFCAAGYGYLGIGLGMTKALIAMPIEDEDVMHCNRNK